MLHTYLCMYGMYVLMYGINYIFNFTNSPEDICWEILENKSLRQYSVVYKTEFQVEPISIFKKLYFFLCERKGMKKLVGGGGKEGEQLRDDANVAQLFLT